jgi:hypothetical protein
MSRYRIENVTFERPARWRGATTACFFAPTSSAGAPSPSITVWQEPLSEGESLMVHAHHALLRLAREVSGFELAGTGDAVVGGRAAYVLHFRYAEGDARSEQTMVMVDPVEGDRALTVFSTAARADRADASRRQLFDLLKSVAFEGRAEPVA